MATNLYLKTATPDLWHATGPRFTVKDAGRGVTPGSELYEGAGGTLLRSLSTTVGTGAGTAFTRTSVAGATSGILLGGATAAHAFISAPLAADITISGTVNFDFCGEEASMNANATIRVAVYRVDQEGALTLIVNSSFGTELTTALGRKSWSASPTSTDMKIGDRILVLPMFDDADGVTMASGHVLTIQADGAFASTADSRVVFTENLTFLTSDPAGSTYYLRDTASDISGAKALSTTQGSGTATAVHATINGPLTFPGDQWTTASGGADIEWFGPAVDAFTLSGAVLVELTNNVDRLEQGSAPNDSLTCELAWCDADGTNPVVWARSYTSTLDTADPKKHYLTGPSTAIAQGKRPRLRFYSDDFRPAGNQSTGTDRTIRYDGVSTYASRIIFTQTITEQPTGPALAGAATLPMLTAASGLTATIQAVGAALLPMLVAAAAATAPIAVTGSSTLPMLVAEGDARPFITANAAATLPMLTASSDVTITAQQIVVDAAATLPMLASAGTVSAPIGLTGSSALPMLTGSGTVSGIIGLAGSPSLPMLTVEAELDAPIQIAGTATIPQLVAAATESATIQLAGSASLPQLIAAADLSATIQLAGSSTLPQLVPSSTVAVSSQVDGAATLPSLVAAGSTAAAAVLDGAATLPMLEAAGSVGNAAVLDGAASIPSLVAAATESSAIALAGSATLPQLIASGDVTSTLQLAGAASIPMLEASGTVAISAQLAGSATLPQLVAAAFIPDAGSVVVSGAVTIPQLTAAGDVSAPIQIAGAALVPQLLGSSTVAVAAGLSGAATLPSLVASGTVSGPAAATLDGAATLPQLLASGTITATQEGEAAATIPMLLASGSVAVAAEISGAAVLPMLSAFATVSRPADLYGWVVPIAGGQRWAVEVNGGPMWEMEISGGQRWLVPVKIIV